MGVEKVAAFIIGGAIGLFILYSLYPGILGTYETLENGTVSGGSTSYFDAAPAGTEAIIGATLVVFSALVLWVMWNELN